MAKVSRREAMRRLGIVAGSAGALAGAAVVSAGGCSPTATSNGPLPGPIQKISEVTDPLAITMVDYSWLLKHHRYGAYENYDQFMSELVERGYNAVRMDCFPHLIAADENGVVQESFWHKKPDRAPMIWGNDYSILSTPRRSLIEFLTKCREYGVHAGLATWFIHHGTDRSARFRSEDDFVRAWDETLTFVRDNGLLDVVTYVDVLNEYPLAHGLTWLDEELNERRTASGVSRRDGRTLTSSPAKPDTTFRRTIHPLTPLTSISGLSTTRISSRGPASSA
jgi:hypothetical protein